MCNLYDDQTIVIIYMGLSRLINYVAYFMRSAARAALFDTTFILQVSHSLTVIAIQAHTTPQHHILCHPYISSHHTLSIPCTFTSQTPACYCLLHTPISHPLHIPKTPLKTNPSLPSKTNKNTARLTCVLLLAWWLPWIHGVQLELWGATFGYSDELVKTLCCINATSCRQQCVARWTRDLPACIPFLPACADALNPIIRLDGGWGNETAPNADHPHPMVTLWRSDDLAWHTAKYDAEARRCCHALAGDYAVTVQDARRQHARVIPLGGHLAEWPPLLTLPAAADGVLEQGGDDAARRDDVGELHGGERVTEVETMLQGPQADGHVMDDYERVNLAVAKDGAKVVAAHAEARKPHALLDQDGDTFMKSDCQV